MPSEEFTKAAEQVSPFLFLVTLAVSNPQANSFTKRPTDDELLQVPYPPFHVNPVLLVLWSSVYDLLFMSMDCD